MGERPHSGRAEDVRLITGHGRFVADIVLPGMLEMAVLRSPHAHARLIEIDLSRALALPGVVAAATAADLGPANRPIRHTIPHPGIVAPRGPLPLASDIVHYVGEPVAAVLAGDRYAAEDALDAIDVVYKTLPVVGELDAAPRPGGPRVHDDMPDNCAGRWTVTTGDVDTALERADRVIRLRLDIERGHGHPLETRGVVARWDAVDGLMTVWTSTQMPHAARDGIAAALQLPARQVRVVVPDVGGGFGLKGALYPEEIVTAWLARKTNRPVRWIEDRREHFHAALHDRLQTHEIEAAVERTGRLIGFTDRVVIDLGAYLMLGFIVANNVQTHVPGPYAVQHIRSEAACVYTHRTPTGPWRGAGRPQGNFVMERIMDRIAAELRLDPVEVRRRNLVRPEQMPYATGLTMADGTPVQYDSGDYPALLDHALAEFGYAGRREEQRAARAAGRLYGIGVCCAVESTSGGPYEGARVWVEGDGAVMVAIASPAQGQGHQTAISHIVGRELGIDPARVTVIGGDTRLIPHGFGTFGSRTLAVAGSAALLAAREVRERAIGLAARLLEASPQDLEMVEGRVSVRGQPGSGKTLAELVRAGFPRSGSAPFPGEPGLVATHYFSPQALAWSSGAAACAVEVDPETAQVRVIAYLAAHDCGSVLNPDLVEGQLIGGVANGIGNTLYERLVYDEHGQLLTATFLDYALPSATEAPPVHTAHLAHPSPLNPLGAKGAGEAGIIPVASVLAQAIEDALKGHNAQITRLPILLESILLERAFESAAGQIDRTPSPPNPSAPVLHGGSSDSTRGSRGTE
ncbi:MAG: molybdopterin cofactor-binding domain-containing protein [Armatimonadota bacterium]